MNKIDFFSVSVSGDSLDGITLTYYKNKLIKDFRFSSFHDASLCFDKLIKNFKSSIEFYNSTHASSYDIIYEDSSKSFNDLCYCIVYRHNCSLVPRTLKIRLSEKNFVLDSFDFDFKL